MGFIDSYKRLEKLCSEVCGVNRGVTAYIDEMINNAFASYSVKGWDDDLRQLKHYRWVRNQIAHDPDCSEENMCEPDDIKWLDDFRQRIMNQTDPLAMYRKATQQKAQSKNQVPYYPQHNVQRQSVEYAMIGMCVIIAIVTFFAIFMLLPNVF